MNHFIQLCAELKNEVMITEIEKEAMENSVKSFDLVKGTYSPEEAKEIVNHLFYKKISFHNHKSFAQILKDGSKNMDSERRVIELEEARSEIIKKIEHLEQEGKTVSIQSNITIASK